MVFSLCFLCLFVANYLTTASRLDSIMRIT